MPHSTNSQNPQGSPDRQTPPGATRVELIIMRGRTRQRVRPVEGPVFLIGTAEDCDLVLVDDRFGAVQGYLIRQGDTVQIRWLDSEPELTVNGQPRDNATLNDQDRIRTGTYEFLIRIFPAVVGDRPSAGSIPAPHGWKPRTAASVAVGANAERSAATVPAKNPPAPPASERSALVAQARLRLFDGPLTPHDAVHPDQDPPSHPERHRG